MQTSCLSGKFLTTPNTHQRYVDLPVHGPTKSELVIKSKTAKALSVTIHRLPVPTGFVT